jgi:tryptophan halogenase
MEQKIKRVIIAGGGTAGWVVAAALAKLLQPLLEVVLVESDEIGTVGVGESTIPTARTFHHLLGIDEREFMRATGSSFKLGIAFEDWARIGDRYFHSFGQIGRSTWMADFHHIWLTARAQGLADGIGAYCYELQAAEAGRFATSDQANINYAYHLDASYYARFLRGFAEAHGARRIEGRIVDAEQDGESGDIAALRLQSGERVEGDLFIDCTGFRGLLIDQRLKAGWEDWGEWLATDRGLAVQTRAVGPAWPYTRAMAHDAGWQWRIPLQHRVGNGLVYSSAHLSDDEASARLLASIEGERLTEPRLIRFKPGRRRDVWVRNCIAFGLSSGFVEPLESTSIHLFMIGVTRLIQLFPFGGISPAVAKRYNDLAAGELERIRDFIILHYKATERDDSAFWRRCRDMAVPDSLAERIALFREGGVAFQASEDLFRVDSWVQVMLGQRIEPRRWHAMAAMMSAAQLGQALGDLRTNISGAVARLPRHEDFLESYCASPAAAA